MKDALMQLLSSCGHFVRAEGAACLSTCKGCLVFFMFFPLYYSYEANWACISQVWHDSTANVVHLSHLQKRSTHIAKLNQLKVFYSVGLSLVVIPWGVLISSLGITALQGTDGWSM